MNSISNYLRTIRAIYNKAIKLRLVKRDFYPFQDVIIKSEATRKRSILKTDILGIEQLCNDENSVAFKPINYFLLSFYLAGISFTDLAYLKKENIFEGRIEFKRRKTNKNYSIKLFPRAISIFDRFKSSKSNYLLPIITDDVIEDSLKAKRLILQWIKTTNKHLKKISIELNINGKITTYTARHTFATTAKRLGYSNELIAEALGHEYGNKTTNIYLDSFDKDIVDAMHYKVIS